MGVLGTALAVLLAIERWGRRGQLAVLFPGLHLAPEVMSLLDLVWWALCCLVGYFIVPTLLIWSQGGRLRDYGCRLPKLRQLAPYLGFYAFMLPLLILVAPTARFQATYPFYRYAWQEPRLLELWWIFYALMFISLEFFFRGFLIHGLAPRFGRWAVLISTVPYFLIHHRKPLPEMLGAFPAGLVLGYLSLRTGSIVGGALLHLAVAFTMDGLQVIR
jgi:membrane protease YdiL (CAAX protease family)